MERLERNRKAFLLSGIGLCLLMIVLTISPGIGGNFLSGIVSRVIVPLQRGANSTLSWVGGHFSALANNQRLITDNRNLEAEINRLQHENFRLSLAAEENAMLNAALNMHQRYAHLPTIGARVIAPDPNPFTRSFRLDRGSNDGIEMGMAIIADGGMAGVIRYVNPTSSQFVSVIDHRFAAAVVSIRTEDTGIARGDITLMQQGYLVMNHIEATAQIMPGDEIMTCLSSAIFPAGLLVGEVVSVHTNPDGLTRYAIIRPAANVASSPEMVLVINEVFGDGRTPRDGEDGQAME
jgi:rod shape-determining protein MreC